MKAVWYNVDPNQYKSLSSGSGGARAGKTIFTYVYFEKKSFSRTSKQISIKHGINQPWGKN
jgi:hypothetical protein